MDRDQTSKMRQVIRDLRPQIEAKLKEIKCDFAFTLGAARFSADVITFKLECGRKIKGGVVASKAGNDFKFYGHRYGMDESFMGATFISKKEKFKVTGLNPKSSKYPILCEKVSDGQTYKFPANLVRESVLKERQSPGSSGKRAESLILAEIRALHIAMSPENLSQDGELPAWKISIARAKLEKQERDLIRELGRTPTESEIS
jgi:hypothetical protein